MNYNMLRLGISQERRRPQPVKNDHVTRLGQNYYEALMAEFPDAVMPYPKLVPINSDWPMLRFPEFPRGIHIVHKMAKGCLDLETGLPEAELRKRLSGQIQLRRQKSAKLLLRFPYSGIV